jgi:hypothetical protein
VEQQDLVSVFMASNSIEAEIVKNALIGQDIKAFVEGGLQAGEMGLAGIPVHVQVPAVDAERARQFIEAHRHQSQLPHPHPQHEPT